MSCKVRSLCGRKEVSSTQTEHIVVCMFMSGSAHLRPLKVSGVGAGAVRGVQPSPHCAFDGAVSGDGELIRP